MEDDILNTLHAECEKGYDEIIEFVTTNEFKSLYGELMALPETKRPQFVMNIMLNQDELKKRNVVCPPHLKILRSAFGDRRPTLFCVKKWLPKRYHAYWENVNITFDNETEEEIAKDGSAWQPPVPVEIQHEYLSGNLHKADVDKVVNALKPITSLSI